MNIPENWTFDDNDKWVASQIQRRMPERIFDAHAHLGRWSDKTGEPTGIWADGPSELSISEWRSRLAQQVGKKRLEGGLLIPSPNNIKKEKEALGRANSYVFDQIAGDRQLKGLALVGPMMSPKDYRELLANPQFAGFKPYHVFSSSRPTFQAPLSTYLPEWAWELAHEHGLVITLHMVRKAALSDPDNLREIRSCCSRYPGARLILAHAARGFHAPNTVESVSKIADLENVWFDTSAICEEAPLAAIIRQFGPRRLLWGSDFPVNQIRGRCVTLGDGFAWLQPDTVKWEKLSPSANPLPVGLESIKALHCAADSLGLNADDMQDIYADNAGRLLGLIQEQKTETKTQKLYVNAKKRIPGGTQLLSKRPELMAPGQWPAYFREARGCEVTDIDGKRYLDMSMNGIGSCLLGYRDPDVTRAVRRRLELGAMSTLNPPEEVELADLLCDIHPWAEQVRFARCGGEACAMAVRIARATTDRSVVAVCGYSGWHDWYLAANLGESDALRGHLLPGLAPLGVPRELRGTAVTFSYNDANEFQEILDRYGDRLAAVIMEPCRSSDPAPGFLESVRDGAHDVGALLIFDEITIGWRLCYGGAHLKFGVSPDMAVFAKALGNGHPMAAVIGTGKAMSAARDSFISSTYWTESVGPVAALATLHKMSTTDVPGSVAESGGRVMGLWREHGKKHGIPLAIDGYPCLPHFRFDNEQAEVLRTLYTQMMLERGFLAGPKFYPTLAHTESVVERYGKAVGEVFDEISCILARGDDPTEYLRGSVAHSGFKRLTK